MVPQPRGSLSRMGGRKEVAREDRDWDRESMHPAQLHPPAMKMSSESWPSVPHLCLLSSSPTPNKGYPLRSDTPWPSASQTYHGLLYLQPSKLPAELGRNTGGGGERHHIN